MCNLHLAAWLAFPFGVAYVSPSGRLVELRPRIYFGSSPFTTLEASTHATNHDQLRRAYATARDISDRRIIACMAHASRLLAAYSVNFCSARRRLILNVVDAFILSITHRPSRL